MHHYAFKSLELAQDAKDYGAYLDELTEMTKWDGSNIHSLLSYSAVRAIFDAYKATFNEIFEWFHNNSDLKTAFQLFESYKQMHEAVFRLSDLQFNRYRFIDS